MSTKLNSNGAEFCITVVEYSPKAGPTYKAADESVVAEVPAGTLTYSTNDGLVVSGATALFRVYVVLATLNERGSNTVGVTRP